MTSKKLFSLYLDSEYISYLRLFKCQVERKKLEYYILIMIIKIYFILPRNS
ncbi:hypothetical protein YN1HA_27900 [Sulfurisphaera ohwakuensis]